MKTRTLAKLPSALEAFGELTKRIGSKKLAVFLDYDGTLTPIVERPEQAVLDKKMKNILDSLSEMVTIGIISGRDLTDVKGLIGLDNLIYAGSHGFDIQGPVNNNLNKQQGWQYLNQLRIAENRLRERLSNIQGIYIEPKKFSIAVHFRQVKDHDLDNLSEIVNQVIDQVDGLRKAKGKKVFEIQPDLDWDKGKALSWLMEALGFSKRIYTPLYIGDDLTDEDAFRELNQIGLSICVGEENRDTLADYRLNNHDEVSLFLEKLIKWLKKDLE